MEGGCQCVVGGQDSLAGGWGSAEMGSAATATAARAVAAGKSECAAARGVVLPHPATSVVPSAARHVNFTRPLELPTERGSRKRKDEPAGAPARAAMAGGGDGGAVGCSTRAEVCKVDQRARTAHA
jgi:hypothetical protein